MIFRRAENLTTMDNVRLDDGLLWNVATVSRAGPLVLVVFSRIAGDKRHLDLFPDDLVLLADG
jgi:hypothetical protein